jgi:hypothetical protein
MKKLIDDNQEVYIYKLIDPENNNIRYVGWTSKEIIYRLKQHLKESRLSDKNHRNRWIRSLLSKNIEPIIEVIEVVAYKIKNEREKYWISFYGRENLVNGTDGGEGGLGRKHSEKTKKILSEKAKEQMKDPNMIEILTEKALEQWKREGFKEAFSEISKKIWERDGYREHQKLIHAGKGAGKNNGMYGKTHSEEARKKISEARKITKRSEETKEKTAMAMIGKKKKNAKSKYFGVCLSKNKFKAQIRHNRKTLKIGVFENEIDAAKAYDKKAYELYGKDALLNFPEDYI